ncbi:MAG: hypothetical protein Q9224_000640 [Gallowayella concinna]
MDPAPIAEPATNPTTSPDTATTSPEHIVDKAPGSSDDSLGQPKDRKPNQGAPRDFRFWAIITSLCITGLLSALENTVVVTSLPTIVHDLDLGDNYIWVTNVFFLTSAAVQPLFGQLANIFGRRWLTMSIVALFTLGSGICGGATNGAMLIAGRAIQGMGSGGINMIVDVIVSDLVPLRERGNFMAIVLTVYFVGTSIGPFVGGAIVDSTTWRWVFYINLPVGGLSLAMLFFSLHLGYQKEMTFLQKMKRIDYGGNTIIIGSTVSVLYALTYGGTRFVWSDGRIVAPLLVGLLGLVGFVAYENTSLVIEPVTPPRLFNNITSAVVFVATFLNSALLYWVMFFLPVYFQVVLGSSPRRSGVQLLPIITIAVPAAIAAVVMLTKWGKYKPLHLVGFAVCTIGLGLFTLLDEDSSMAEWVIYQMITGGGSGFEKLAYRIDDPSLQQLLSAGRAYEYAAASFLRSIPVPVRGQVIGVYNESLKLVWQISIVFSGVAFLFVLLEKQIKLRTELDTEYGLEERKKEKQAESGTAEGDKSEDDV